MINDELLNADELDQYVSEQAGIEDESTEGEDQTAQATTNNEEKIAQPNQDQTSGEQKPVQAQQPNTTDPLQQSQQTSQTLAEGVKPHHKGGYTDEKGNIVEANGTVIAQNGFARRIHEQNQRQAQVNEQQNQQINALSSRLEERNILTDTARSYNLDNDDIAMALDIANKVKTGNVVAAAKDIVTLLAAQGHNVSEILGDDVGDSIDMRAMKQLLDQRLGPIETQRNDNEQVEAQQQQAQKEYNLFLTNNHNADIHEEAIVGVMKAQGCNPQQAYNQIVQYSHQHNFDFNQPLGPQLEARQAADNAQQGNGNNSPLVNSRPIPNGNGANTRPQGGVQPTPNIYANPDDTWGEIIKSVQAQAGQ